MSYRPEPKTDAPPETISIYWGPRCGRTWIGVRPSSRYHWYRGQKCTCQPVTVTYSMPQWKSSDEGGA